MRVHDLESESALVQCCIQLLVRSGRRTCSNRFFTVSLDRAAGADGCVFALGEVLSQHAQQAQAIADVCRPGLCHLSWRVSRIARMAEHDLTGHLLALQLHTHLCGSTLSCFHSDSAAPRALCVIMCVCVCVYTPVHGG